MPPAPILELFFSLPPSIDGLLLAPDLCPGLVRRVGRGVPGGGGGAGAELHELPPVLYI